MKALNRNAAIDAYTLEELRREYRVSDTKERIQLLERLYSGERFAWQPPFEIALMAVEDSSLAVRQWIARQGKSLDYREEVRQVTGTQTSTREYRFPDRNLEQRLRDDPDPFVRACLYENPNVYSSLFLSPVINNFKAATHLERLALMRNPQIGRPNDLIEKILDLDDRELGISFEQRNELVRAYLTNGDAVKRSHRAISDFPGDDGGGWFRNQKHFADLWRLASKWPEETLIRELVYEYIGVQDEAQVAPLVKNADEDALWALASNPSVSGGLLRKVRRRLIKLGVDKSAIRRDARTQKNLIKVGLIASCILLNYLLYRSKIEWPLVIAGYLVLDWYILPAMATWLKRIVREALLEARSGSSTGE
jgi:hypothetical protein